jgi:peptidoglycan/LPS O-acetylase OafA/YrhL
MKRRPGRLWLFFWGRKRRGFPGLLVAVVLVLVALALLYGLPGGSDLSRWWYAVSFTALVLLILGSLAVVVVALIRPPRGRR